MVCVDNGATPVTRWFCYRNVIGLAGIGITPVLLANQREGMVPLELLPSGLQAGVSLMSSFTLDARTGQPDSPG